MVQVKKEWSIIFQKVIVKGILPKQSLTLLKKTSIILRSISQLMVFIFIGAMIVVLI